MQITGSKMVATSYFISGAVRSSRRAGTVSASSSGVAKKMLLRNRSIAAKTPKPVAPPETCRAWKEGPASAEGGLTSTAPTGRPRTRPEAGVRDALAASIPGARTEVPCSSGFVDIVTPSEIVEVKRAQLWKGGLGQVLVYSKDFPGLTPRLHLFGARSYEHFALAHTACEMFGVKVTTEEGHSRPAPAPPEPAAAPPSNPTPAGKAKTPGTGGTSPRAPDRGSWRAWGSLCLGYVCGRSA